MDDDVQDISTKQNPHGNAGIGNTVGKLLEGIEPKYEWHGCQKDEKVGTHQGDKLFRLSQPVHIQVKQVHDGAYHNRQYRIGGYAVLQGLSGSFVFVLSEQAAHYRSQSIGKTGTEDNGQSEHVVDEAGGSQFRCTVVSYHQGIRKSQDDDAYLSDDDRNPQSQ